MKRRTKYVGRLSNANHHIKQCEQKAIYKMNKYMRLKLRTSLERIANGMNRKIFLELFYPFRYFHLHKTKQILY